jgi:aminoglycoside phosphotransferase (APT) family kinase protein
VIHNDYKYDNIVLDPRRPGRVVAVLDWEMATVGDPLMDLGTSLAYWVDAEDLPQLCAFAFGPTALPGGLDREGVVAAYREATGRAVDDPVFYFVYGLFKVAVVAQQIYQRFASGLTSDPRFGAMIMGVHVLTEVAERAIERGRISRIG